MILDCDQCYDWVSIQDYEKLENKKRKIDYISVLWKYNCSFKFGGKRITIWCSATSTMIS